MATIPVGATKTDVDTPFDDPGVHEEVIEEIIDTLQPDRAHHDELGRTVDHADGCEPSPREQPAEPIDVDEVDE
jgi:hypothetical protein